MTRKEAIDILKNTIVQFGRTNGKTAYAEALQMAIKALEQPEIIHCQDCIYWKSKEFVGNNDIHTLNLASLPCKNWLTAGDWYCGSAERWKDAQQRR